MLFKIKLISMHSVFLTFVSGFILKNFKEKKNVGRKKKIGFKKD